MATKKNEPDVTWGIRGVPQPLIEKVKETAKEKGLNIGKIVELSLKEYFEKNADKKDTDLESKIEGIVEMKLKELNLPTSPPPNPA